jgi:hypothetical protein
MPWTRLKGAFDRDAIKLLRTARYPLGNPYDASLRDGSFDEAPAVADMSDTKAPILEYANSSRPVGSVLARVIAGILAGAVTYGATRVLGSKGVITVAVVSGLAVGVVSSAWSTKRLLLAGIVGNLIAWTTLIFIWAAIHVARSTLVRYGLDWSEVLYVASMFLAFFVGPGLLGSLWVWEGRKPAPWDDEQRGA